MALSLALLMVFALAVVSLHSTSLALVGSLDVDYQSEKSHNTVRGMTINFVVPQSLVRECSITVHPSSQRDAIRDKMRVFHIGVSFNEFFCRLIVKNSATSDNVNIKCFLLASAPIH
ncbi:hypothetical protein KDW_06900 [Dictyobacter vulcani]|uniref:Uncharacterized protein n=1 Tax=Dictyobacter vulcani TaxID=2607529 RepID=A0A5J4KCL3_9CHLR|nr:hypothetical protein KDW_06900 [Dictyobacter vulcani]